MKRLWISLLLVAGLGFGYLSFTTPKNNFFEISKQLEIFIDLYKHLNTNYVDELVPAQVMEKAITGILEDLDPYTIYRNEQQIIDARINHSGQYAGIGARIHFTGDKIIILEAYEYDPAAEAGLLAGDEIIEVNGIKIADIDTEAQHNLLTGEAGSEIQLVYERAGKKQQTKLSRATIERAAVPYYKLLEDNIGYIVLETFTSKAASETKAALEHLKTQGAEKIILDLRNNPGGLLGESVKIVNLFIPKGKTVTYTESVIKKYNKVYKTMEEPVDTEIPLAILINENSASASEIVSGSLQDLDRAVVIGNRSFGKGLVQREMPMSYSTQLKVTISRYFTPSGRSIQELDYETNLVDKRNIQDKNQVFYTKNKRKVYGGGGISPDKELDDNTDIDFIRSLNNKLYYLNFGTDFLKKNPIANPNRFKLKEKDWQDFKAFLHAELKLNRTEKAWKKFATEAEKDGLDSEIKLLKAELDKKMSKALDEKIEAHKKTLMQNLGHHLIVRTHLQTAAYDYAIQEHEAINMAKTLLNNPKEYHSILNK